MTKNAAITGISALTLVLFAVAVVLLMISPFDATRPVTVMRFGVMEDIECMHPSRYQ